MLGAERPPRSGPRNPLWRNGIPRRDEEDHQTEEHNRLEAEDTGVDFRDREDENQLFDKKPGKNEPRHARHCRGDGLEWSREQNGKRDYPDEKEHRP